MKIQTFTEYINEAIVSTGYLNYHIDIDKVKSFLSFHPKLYDLIKKYPPKKMDNKSFLKSYNAFSRDMNKLDLTEYGFLVKDKIKDALDNIHVYYKSPKGDFFWSELYEAVHLNLVTI